MSVGNSMTTYRNIESREEAWQVILALSESICRRLRENESRARTLEVSGRRNDLLGFGYQTKLFLPACTVEEIAHPAMKLQNARYDFSMPLRSLGVLTCNLTDLSGGIQLTFGDDATRKERLEQSEGCVDILARSLRTRFALACNTF